MTFWLRTSFVSCGMIAIAVVLLGCDRNSSVGTPEARAILERMASTYAECESYSDSGKVTTKFMTAEGDETVVKPFSTAMIRPDQFRYEFSVEGDPRSRYIVWQKGSQVSTWWDVGNRSEQPQSLGLGLAGATGVSSGSAHTIPALLMPTEVGGRLLTDVDDAKCGDDQNVAGFPCFTIEARYAGDPIKIWVDQETFLVRRIDSENVFDDFKTEQTTTYQPVVNGEIDPELLKYRGAR